MEKHLHYRAGEWTQDLGKVHFRKMNPWQPEEQLAEISYAEPLDFVLSLQKTKDAYLKFSKSDLEKRRQFLAEILEQIQNSADEIALEESLYQGLPLKMTRASVQEIILLGNEILAELTEDFVQSGSPRGLTLILSSWALSFQLIGEALLRALVNLSPVLIKPSEHSSISGIRWAKIIEKTSLPPGVVQVFHGGQEFSQFLTQHPAIKSIVFTGKTETGKNILSRIDLLQKKVSLRMSTRNSIILLPDVSEEDLEKALDLFWLGQGQTCWNAGRLFFLDSEEKNLLPRIEAIYDRYLSQGICHFESQNSLWNPLLTESSLQKNLEIKQQVLAEEGRLLRGGDLVEKNYISPLLALHLPQCSELQGQDVPIINLGSVKYLHEFSKWVNNIDLAQDIWIYGDSDRAKKIAPQFQVGHVRINESWQQGLRKQQGEKFSFYGEDFLSFRSRLWRYQAVK